MKSGRRKWERVGADVGTGVGIIEGSGDGTSVGKGVESRVLH